VEKTEEIEAYLVSLGYPIKKKVNMPIYYFDYKGENGSWVTFLEISRETDCITFYCTLNEKADKNRFSLIREFLNKGNFVLNIGCFSLDDELGTINYRIAQKIYKNVSLIDTIDNILRIGLRIMDNYAAGINQVLLYKADVQSAMEKVYEQQKSYDIFEL